MKINDIINGCIKVEKSVASIYSTFMQLFPEEKDFWEGLYKAEIEHSSFLMDTKSLGLINELKKISLLPSMQIINKTLKLVDNITKKISKNPISLKSALKMTLVLEETIVEVYTNKAIENLLDCDNKSCIKKILLDGKLHIDKVKDMIIKKGFSKLS